MKVKRFRGILGIGLTAGLVVASLAAILAVPASAGEMEWTLTNTPSWEDMVILPASDILDYDIGGDGNTIYAVLEVDAECTGVGEEIGDSDDPDFALVKSTDGGVTWSDITAKVTGAANLPANGFETLVAVAVAPDDKDWLAVIGYEDNGDPGDPMVIASKDGGSNFTYAGDMIDNGYNNGGGSVMDIVYDLDVSIEVDDIHNIAVAGINNAPVGCVYRLKAGTWLTGTWVDTSDIHATTDYPGWLNATPNFCVAAVAVAFSDNFDIDDSVVCLTLHDPTPNDTDCTAYLQSGIWETNGSWNAEAGFGDAPDIASDGDDLLVDVFMRSVGLALPDDYDGSDPGARSVFVYVDATNATTTLEGGFVFRIDNGAISPTCGPSGDPLLSSIDVHGDADTGKMMIGEYIKWDQDEGNGAAIMAPCCDSVRVWHTEELDFCCPQWDGACKDPSGPYLALVMYTPDGEKEYATTSGTTDDGYFGRDLSDSVPFVGDPGTPLDESAFSVSLDDAVSFNQIGLFDTDIDTLSDVAVCPD